MSAWALLKGDQSHRDGWFLYISTQRYRNLDSWAMATQARARARARLVMGQAERQLCCCSLYIYPPQLEATSHPSLFLSWRGSS